MNYIKSIKKLFKASKTDCSKQTSRTLNNKEELIYTFTDDEVYDIELSKSESKRTYNIVTIADCHGTLKERELIDAAEVVPDIVVLLGDNTPSDLDLIVEFFTKAGFCPSMVGVTGNHDEEALLRNYYSDKIADLHMKEKSLNSITFCGFDGSIRYKPDKRYAMYSNEESEEMLSSLSSCDILIAHDKPCFKKPKTLTSHSGLTGLGDYIKANNPKLMLHGHLHDRYIKKYKNTVIRCCYRVEHFAISI